MENLRAVKLYILPLSEIKKNEQLVLKRLSAERIDEARAYTNEKGYLNKLGSSFLVDYYTGSGKLYYGEKGKPEKANAYFNVSHDGDFVILGVAAARIGVDILKIGRFDKAVIARACSEDEAKCVKTPYDFALCWSQKESLLKCVGAGLSGGLKAASSIVGKKTFDGATFFSRSLEYEDHVISITLRTDEEGFDIEILPLELA